MKMNLDLLLMCQSQKKGEYNDFHLPIGKLSTYKIEIIANPFMNECQIENLKVLLTKYGLEKFLSFSQMDIRK